MTDYATSIDIDAPPEVVFAHLVTAEGIRAWLGREVELDPAPGGTFAVDVDGSAVRGTYLWIDPPHRVAVSWGVYGSDDHPPASSRVEFTLTPIDTGTRLDLVHSGLPKTRAAGHAAGWAHYLAGLRRASGAGAPGPRPDPWEAS